MSPTNIPTDNLYKFCAIAGLVLMITSFLTMVTFNHSLGIRVAEEEGLVRAVEREQKVFDKLGISVNDLNPKSEYLANKISRHLDNLDKASSSLAVLKELHSQQVFLSIACSIGLVAGFLLSNIGFGLWYRKLQRYQDFIVMAEARNLTTRSRLTSQAAPEPQP